MAIVRWEPFRDLVAVQERMNRIFDEAFRGHSRGIEDEWALGGSWAVDPGPSRTVAPRVSSNVAFSRLASVSASSSTTTFAPNSSSPSAAANPDTPIPAMTTTAWDHAELRSATPNQSSSLTAAHSLLCWLQSHETVQ